MATCMSVGIQMNFQGEHLVLGMIYVVRVMQAIPTASSARDCPSCMANDESRK